MNCPLCRNHKNEVKPVENHHGDLVKSVLEMAAVFFALKMVCDHFKMKKDVKELKAKKNHFLF
ncbi:MAG: hypothetical protein HUJ55_04630 [Ileibacterium sp.]|nr:hypothetical protein [Ileibacterium sp.]